MPKDFTHYVSCWIGGITWITMHAYVEARGQYHMSCSAILHLIDFDKESLTEPVVYHLS